MSAQSPKPFIVLGVSGGIAAYKAIEVCRQLVDAGCHVAPILTENATKFVAPLTFTALASEPAQTKLYDGSAAIPHTRLGQSASVIVVAPATAHLIARMAAGLADDLLTATLLATRATVIVAPAMHTEMWEQPSVQDNLATLRSRGVTVVEPEVGRLAGGDEGAGRLADPGVIVAAVLDEVAAPRATDLAGTKVLVSSGGTREPIDPVRFLSNRSSGKQGHAIAAAAAERGAEVVLVTTMPQTAPHGVEVEAVDTAAQMNEAMARHARVADVVVMAAAVADFRPSQAASSKVKRELGTPEIVLEPTEDILCGLVKARTKGQIIVGFAAETDDVLANAVAKLDRKGCDLLVVNDVSAPAVGFDHDTNAVHILERGGGVVEVPLASKRAVAESVLDMVVRHLGEDEGKTSS